MGEMHAIALARVSREAITQVLRRELSLEWNNVMHVTATTTLARAIQARRVVALPIATLLDLVTLPGLPGEMRLPVDAFPKPDLLAQSLKDYRARVTDWQSEASGRRLRTGIQMDDSLRRFVRNHAPDRVGQALLASRRQYATTVHGLIAAGVRPGGLLAQDPAGQLAAKAWAQAEIDVPSLGAARELLWVDLEELAEGSTPEARGLTDRITSALEAAFGDGVRSTIVHHGFYFYSPVQWAFFQALARVPRVDQVFIVHDDGANPAFSTWRYFFRSEWQMPVPKPAPIDEEVTPAAGAFREVLTRAGGGSPAGVEVVECRSPAELVRLWRAEDEGDAPPARYAASAEQVERYVGRLAGRRVSSGEAEDAPATPALSQLPVGQFLLAVHGCITASEAGAPSFALSGDALLDMVASGYLEVQDPASGAGTPLLRRVLPYFAGCRSGEEWTTRSDELVLAISKRVSPRGPRTRGDNDATRMGRAVANPTRLVPWADISEEESRWVQGAIAKAVRLLSETTARERVILGSQLNTIRRQLDRALRRLPPEEARSIEAKLRGVGVLTHEEIDVVGLVDVVAMILGRRIDTPGADEDPTQTRVKQLRGLDALGLARIDTNLHLANMAEDSFPSHAQTVGWPFTLADLRASTHDAVEPVTAGLLETRGQTVGLSDLYLFWLALDGVAPGATVTVSWVSDSAGERRRLSPIVSLLTQPGSTEAVRRVAGGVSVGTVPSLAEREPDRVWPEPLRPDTDDLAIDGAVDAIPVRAAAAARACPRRFAIQWAMGPTASFGPAHLQSMLFGNVVGALELGGEPQLLARATGNVLWPQLTDGQRASSYEKRVVRSRGADPTWVLTLHGSQNGRSDLDAAYQMAKDGKPATAAAIAPNERTLLPPRAGSAEVCAYCPVQARCAEWRDPRDER